VVIAAGEKLQDSLVATAQTVLVEGDVEGDVIAFAQRVEIRGRVTGDVVAFAQHIEMAGAVEGSVYSFAQTSHVSGEIVRNLYAAAQTVRVARAGRVLGDIIACGADVDSDGRIGRGLTAFAGSSRIAGEVGRDATFHGGRLRLESTARVGGTLTAHVGRQQDVTVVSGAVANVKVEKAARDEPRRWAGGFSVLWGIISLGAALLTGWLLVRLAPGFTKGAAGSLSEFWRPLGLGFVLLVVTPVAIVLGALTLIGLPLALAAGAAYAALVYISKIVVAVFLGTQVLRSLREPHPMLALLVGLLMLTAAFHVPFGIGWLAKFVAVCLGTGAIAWYLYRARLPGASAKPV
jgi:cytoskeletal protein CcmA (bactofilin family)